MKVKKQRKTVIRAMKRTWLLGITVSSSVMVGGGQQGRQAEPPRLYLDLGHQHRRIDGPRDRGVAGPGGGRSASRVSLLKTCSSSGRERSPP